MSLTIEVFKGGTYVALQNVSLGAPILETIDGELDKATIKFTALFENVIDVLNPVRITAGAYQRCFIAADIQTDKTASYSVYEYVVSLIAPEKYLEKVVCPSMSFTNPNDSLLDQIEKALLNAEPVEAGSIPRFRLSDKAKTALAGIPGADFFFERMNLREILDGFLSRLDARCVVKEITDYDDIVIDFRYLDRRGNKIISLPASRKRTIRNIEYLGSDVESYAENALVTYSGPSLFGRRVPIYHPSPNGWDTFKTNESTLTSSNAVISTAFPIETITNFFLPGPFVLKGHYDAGHGGGEETLLILPRLDISRNVLDEETYNILKQATLGTKLIETDKQYQQNTIYYTRGQTEIHNLRYPIFFGIEGSHLANAANNAFWNDSQVQSVMQSAEFDWYEISSPYSGSTNISSVRFQLLYIPQVDAHLKIDKDNYSSGPAATIISQQSDRIIDLVRYGDNLRGLINRVGNKEIYIDAVLDSPSEMFDLGDYTEDGYVLTSREFAIYENDLEVRYTFTKDFNARSRNIGIDRQKRIYNIPLEYFRSDTIIKQYIVAHHGSPSVNDKVINQFLRTFSDGSRHITNALVKTYWQGGESDLFELPLIGFAAGNTVNLHFRFRDNYSAGMSVENLVVGGRKVIPNPYVNELGEYDEIEIKLFWGGIKYPAADELARARQLPKVALGEYDSNGFIFSQRYRRKKDAYEHQSFTICFGIRSAEPDIIIGPALIENCALWYTASPDLRVYVTSESVKYMPGDKIVQGVVATDQSITVNDGYISVAFSNSGVQAWAIGDENRNLYIACNDSNRRTIQFIRRKRL